jgi:hypothetical protein
VVEGSRCGLLKDLHIRLLNVIVVDWYVFFVVGFDVTLLVNFILRVRLWDELYARGTARRAWRVDNVHLILGLLSNSRKSESRCVPCLLYISYPYWAKAQSHLKLFVANRPPISSHTLPPTIDQMNCLSPAAFHLDPTILEAADFLFSNHDLFDWHE